MVRDLNAIRVFIDASHTLNFTKTAKNLHMTPSAISRNIAKLEEDLSAKLFLRSTRNIALTEEGAYFLGQAKRWLEGINETSDFLKNALGTLTGPLRISMPVAFGHCVMQSHIQAFHAIYPDVTFEILYTDELVDLIGLGLDAAIRIGHLEDSELIAKPLTQVALVTSASPDYLHLHPQPRVPTINLSGNRYLGYLNSRTGKTLPWRFRNHEEETQYVPDISMALNNGQALVDFAMCGKGIVQLHEYLVAKPLRDNTLVRLWQAFEAPGHEVNLVYLRNTYQSKRLRAFIDYLSDVFS